MYISTRRKGTGRNNGAVHFFLINEGVGEVNQAPARPACGKRYSQKEVRAKSISIVADKAENRILFDAAASGQEDRVSMETTSMNAHAFSGEQKGVCI